MDDAIIEVLEQYHARMERENLSFPVAAPGGRNSVNFQSMRAIGPETGQFLNILVHSLTAPRILELGTSFGYSAIWLAEAARATGGHLTTLEIDPERSAHALDMSTQAGLSPLVDFRIGDAVTLIDSIPDRFDFVFVNLRKDLYLPCRRPSIHGWPPAPSSSPTTSSVRAAPNWKPTSGQCVPNPASAAPCCRSAAAWKSAATCPDLGPENPPVHIPDTHFTARLSDQSSHPF